MMRGAAFIVVFSEGAKADDSIAFGFNGQRPVLCHAFLMMSVMNTFSHAFE